MHPDSTMRTLAGSFGAVAGAYQRGRPGYAPEAIDRLRAELDLRPGMRVLDLGAGTGKLTALLAPTGAELFAVEPDPRMRELLTQSVPAATALEGSAESIPLPDGSVQAVVAGSSFHWFDTHPALREIHRVLAGGGRLALLWNPEDDPRSEWSDRVHELMDRYTTTRGGHSLRAWGDELVRDGLFGDVREWWFPWKAELTVDEIVDRTTSISHVASLPPERRERLLGAVRRLLEGRPSARGTLTVRLRTRLICCQGLPIRADRQ